jgi:predicted nucleic acid-binding protein
VTFVVDSSVALSWCFDDERTPATRALLERIGETGASAPQHWPAEVLNGLMMAERRQRIGPDQRRRLADFLRDLPIVLDVETVDQVWSSTQTLAERFRLTVYDAIYLEQAHRRRLPLATLDRALRAAASSLGVSVLGLADV